MRSLTKCPKRPWSHKHCHREVGEEIRKGGNGRLAIGLTERPKIRTCRGEKSGWAWRYSSSNRQGFLTSLSFRQIDMQQKRKPQPLQKCNTCTIPEFLFVYIGANGCKETFTNYFIRLSLLWLVRRGWSVIVSYMDTEVTLQTLHGRTYSYSTTLHSTMYSRRAIFAIPFWLLVNYCQINPIMHYNQQPGDITKYELTNKNKLRVICTRKSASFDES